MSKNMYYYGIRPKKHGITMIYVQKTQSQFSVSVIGHAFVSHGPLDQKQRYLFKVFAVVLSENKYVFATKTQTNPESVLKVIRVFKKVFRVEV